MANGLGDEILWACPTISQSAQDLSGNSYDGSMLNGASVVENRYNNGTHAFSLDGTNDSIEFDYIASMDQTSQLAISLWIYREGSSFDFYLTKGSSSARTPYIRSFYDGAIEFTLDLYDGSTTYRQTHDGYGVGVYQQWIHLVLSWDGTTTKSYANTVEIDSSTNDTGLLTKPDGGRKFNIGVVNGQVDDVRVFNNVLTTEEIRHLNSHRGVENKPAVGLFDIL